MKRCPRPAHSVPSRLEEWAQRGLALASGQPAPLPSPHQSFRPPPASPHTQGSAPRLPEGEGRDPVKRPQLKRGLRLPRSTPLRKAAQDSYLPGTAVAERGEPAAPCGAEEVRRPRCPASRVGTAPCPNVGAQRWVQPEKALSGTLSRGTGQPRLQPGC